MENSGGWVTRKVEKLRKSPLFADSEEKERERWFQINGSKLLKETIKLSKDGLKCNPIRSFSAKQVVEATDGFKHIYFENGIYCWYEGSLDGRSLLFKKYRCRDTNDDAFPFRDIVVSSQMSNHKNVLKLLGCCLEFKDPVLVYEPAVNGLLRNFVGTGNNDYGLSLSWKMRLRIAKDVANAITYRHTAFPQPIVYRDIKPACVFLDENYVPKLGGFTFSVSIPEGKTEVKEEEVIGTLGFLDPHYGVTGNLSEFSDVYSFGIFVLVLLTGKSAANHDQTGGEQIHEYAKDLLEKGQYGEIVDRRLFGDGERVLVERQICTFLELAMSCASSDLENRPMMIDVAKKLGEIERSTGLNQIV